MEEVYSSLALAAAGVLILLGSIYLYLANIAPGNEHLLFGPVGLSSVTTVVGYGITLRTPRTGAKPLWFMADVIDLVCNLMLGLRTVGWQFQQGEKHKDREHRRSIYDDVVKNIDPKDVTRRY